MNKYADEFYATFQELARKYSAEKVWQDVIYACALTQSVFLRSQDKSGLEKIDKIMEQYSEKEQYKIMSLYANIMDALQENPGQDFLGEMYHRLDLQKHEKGQFFTPYDVCKLMTLLSLSTENLTGEISQKGYVTVSDPACGSGALLLSFYETVREMGITGYQVLAVAQDVDRSAALMCYLQLSVLFIPAIVIVGNSITNPGIDPQNEVWYTPAYNVYHWHYERYHIGEGTDLKIAVSEDITGIKVRNPKDDECTISITAKKNS